MSKSITTSVARFAGKNESAFVFLGLDPTVLYRLAALPDEKSAALTSATKKKPTR
ncbi:MAG: hypothetical protein WCI03_11600 [bacterium]|jgi:hypothetical protein